ncbi:hypothetical protein L6164_009678 [Bauhinia variegata]|uniref:Uncharacterized protein n=1 Tax=Bauhinia variegata TaxID=167791 RepID=A0ACB9PKN6_BAUVA|nr:hypothetical protein L6164_009678 [Bauhinia variegata]
MEFWGVEVKSGEALKVSPGDNKILHLSQASLGEVKKDKGSEPVSLFVKFGDQKLGLGMLSSEKFPQISFDLVFEKEFELSHNCKNGSVYFVGYKARGREDEFSDDSEFEDDVIPFGALNNDSQVKQESKPDANAGVQKANNLKAGDPKKDGKTNQKEDDDSEDEEDSSEDESDEDSDEDVPMLKGVTGSEDEDDSDDDNDDDDDESEDEETPKTAEASKKRPMESAKKTPQPEKKAKLVTPQKTDVKRGVPHVATPHPSKGAGKAAASKKDQAKQQTPKSGGDYTCTPCNRSFKTDDALQSHNRAKHSAK